MRAPRGLLEDCCGWNRKLWADALEFALSQLPEDISGRSVVELGASRYSSLAPIFASGGADVVCSHYGSTRGEIEAGQLGLVTRKHGLQPIPVVEIDVNDLSGVYDIIALKSVLGGLCRGNDYARLRGIFRQLLDHLSPQGSIVTVDNGHVSSLQRLRKLRGAGRNNWTYFRAESLAASIEDGQVRISGFGFLNFGTTRLFGERNAELVNDLVYLIDGALVRAFRPKERAVLATVITKN